MKLDYDQAWQETVQLLKGSRGLLAVIAGVFFFVPYAALLIAVPELSAMGSMGSSEAEVEAMTAAMMAVYRQYWWAFLAIALVQALGLLAMLSLLRRQTRPTVGEALSEGVRGLLPYLAAQIIQSVAIVMVALLIGVIVGVTGSVGVGVVLGLLALVGAIYFVVKLVLLAPVVAMEGVRNPLAALRRSWALTKGNSVRLFFFGVLLIIAAVIVSSLLSAVFNLVLALFGAEVARFGSAMVSAAINAGIVTLFTAVLAAVYNQLARLRSRTGEVTDLTT